MESFNRRLLQQILIGLTQAIIVLTQGATLNYYIISDNSSKFEPYFYFLGDIICVFLFAGYQAVSYRHLIAFDRKTTKDVVDFPASIGCFNPRKNMSSCLSATSWTTYSLLLTIKIVVIFTSNGVGKLSTNEVAGPQLLKVAIALATFVFLLQVEGYNWSKRGSPRYDYVHSECFRTAIEILDSVSLLSLLLPGGDGLLEKLPNWFNLLATLFSCFNLIFPLFILYYLYSVDFKKPQLKVLPLIHNCFHIVFSDIAFLTIRLYLWVQFNHNASIFLMKNILGILHSLREIFPMIMELRRNTGMPQKLVSKDINDIHMIDDAEELKKINELCT